MIIKQYLEVISGDKTETRRTGDCNRYIVGRSQAVVPKLYQPAVWYYFMDGNPEPCIWQHPIMRVPNPKIAEVVGWHQLRVLILAKTPERLHEIDEQGAKDEGILCDPARGFYTNLPNLKERYFDTGVQAYAYLWDFINGKTKGKRWQDNPEVKVITFKREAR